VEDCSGILRDGFVAFSDKIYSDPLVAKITWYTNTIPCEFGSEKGRVDIRRQQRPARDPVMDLANYHI